MAYGEYRGHCTGRIMNFIFKMDPSSDSWAKYGWDKTRQCPVIYNSSRSHPDDIRGMGMMDPRRKYPDGRIFGWITWENDGDSDYPILELEEFFKTDENAYYQYAWDHAVKMIKEYEARVGRLPYSLKEEERMKKIDDLTHKAMIRAQIFNDPFSRLDKKRSEAA